MAGREGAIIPFNQAAGCNNMALPEYLSGNETDYSRLALHVLEKAMKQDAAFPRHLFVFGSNSYQFVGVRNYPRRKGEASQAQFGMRRFTDVSPRAPWRPDSLQEVVELVHDEVAEDAKHNQIRRKLGVLDLHAAAPLCDYSRLPVIRTEPWVSVYRYPDTDTKIYLLNPRIVSKWPNI